MKFALLLVALLGATADANARALTPSLRETFGLVAKKMEHQRQMAKELKEHGVKDITVSCALCGVAVNEVLGLMLENRTKADIESELRAFCAVFPSPVSSLCDDLANQLPALINLIENHYTPSGVCIELKFCTQPYLVHQDPYPVPSFSINLDLPPAQRFKEVCSYPLFQQSAQYLVTAATALLGADVATALGAAGTFLNDYYFPTERAEEIRGCSAALGISAGWSALMNLGYEVSDACTSIVAAAPDGSVIHARNLDFWMGMGFTDTLKNMSYTATFLKGGRPQYITGQLAGYVGVLSGQKLGKFSITVNTRFYPGGIIELFDEVIAAIEERNASLVTFLVREVLNNENDFNAALRSLMNTELIADVYYTLAGVSAARNEGATIARNRTHARYIWALDVANGVWFNGVSNYDHAPGDVQPWWDDRWDPAVDYMNSIGRADASVSNIFNKVMSVKPVLNLQTTYTTMSVPANQSWSVLTRWCAAPCTQ